MKNKFSSSIGQSLSGRPEADARPKETPVSSDISQKMKEEPKTVPRAKKHPGGRPSNKTRGIESRQKYSLTLPSDTYDETLALANEEGLSFSKYVERALKEYKVNHPTS